MPSNTLTFFKLFKIKLEYTTNTNAEGLKNTEIAVPLKDSINFWRTLEILFIYWEIKITLSWSDNSVISTFAELARFPITYTKFYIPVVTLSTQKNTTCYNS